MKSRSSKGKLNKKVRNEGIKTPRLLVWHITPFVGRQHSVIDVGELSQHRAIVFKIVIKKSQRVTFYGVYLLVTVLTLLYCAVVIAGGAAEGEMVGVFKH